MKKIIIIFSIISMGLHTKAQQFISKGTITFERKTNMWAEIPENLFEAFKKMVPEYKSDNFTLSFDKERSLYAPNGEVKKFMFNLPANDNIVYIDFKKDQSIATKSVFEKTYLIEDSLRNATWKIKDDFREIAGFNCRRATTILFDSVFVVAFYTDEILLPGGPESINGLPGTILGLVINRLHTTWYATKVDATQVNGKSIAPPSKGTKITLEELDKILQASMKNFKFLADRLKWSVAI